MVNQIEINIAPTEAARLVENPNLPSDIGLRGGSGLQPDAPAFAVMTIKEPTEDSSTKATE